MLKKMFSVFTFVAFFYRSQSQDIVQLLSTRLPDVSKDASVIKRQEDIYFEVTDIDRAYLTVHKVLTVTGVNGKDALTFYQHSNRFIELADAEIKVYDAFGKQTVKYKKRDMITIANGDGLIDDGKVTYFSVPANSYPITVEYNYEIKYKGTLFYPSYEILGSGESVENSSFTAKVPIELDMRYKEKNIHLKPEISSTNKYKTYKWVVKNMSPLEDEEGTVSYESKYPQIILAPNKFKIYDTEGDMTSWKNFGLWQSSLTKGLNELSADRSLFFKDLVKDAKDTKEKIKIVYAYLQKNFRYVSIQLGIGGYKPFPALFTDQKKYGDCKGLSFYTHSVLNALGIKSYVALINSNYNDEPVDPAFPCNDFNHMILCVPQKDDSIWLECTSNTNEFAVLGSFTENRYALLITENGGELVPTPSSKSGDNTLQSTTTIKIAEDGSGTATYAPKVKGSFKQYFMQYLLEEKKDVQKDFLIDYIGMKQPDVFTVNKNDDPELAPNIELVFEKIPEFTAGNKMFLPLRMCKLWDIKLPKSENRRLDYYFQYPFEKSDTSIYTLPKGYAPDVLPTAKHLQCDFAKYSTKYWYNEKEQAVYSTASLVLYEYKIPAAGYAKMKAFYEEILKDGSQRIVVKKL